MVATRSMRRYRHTPDFFAAATPPFVIFEARRAFFLPLPRRRAAAIHDIVYILFLFALSMSHDYCFRRSAHEPITAGGMLPMAGRSGWHGQRAAGNGEKVARHIACHHAQQQTATIFTDMVGRRQGRSSWGHVAASPCGGGGAPPCVCGGRQVGVWGVGWA